MIITLIRGAFDRSYPKLDFYHTDGIRTMMVDILFVYAKLKPDVSYRQVSRCRASDGAYGLCCCVVLRNALSLLLVYNTTKRVFQLVSVFQCFVSAFFNSLVLFLVYLNDYISAFQYLILNKSYSVFLCFSDRVFIISVC